MLHQHDMYTFTKNIRFIFRPLLQRYYVHLFVVSSDPFIHIRQGVFVGIRITRTEYRRWTKTTTKRNKSWTTTCTFSKAHIHSSKYVYLNDQAYKLERWIPLSVKEFLLHDVLLKNVWLVIYYFTTHCEWPVGYQYAMPHSARDSLYDVRVCVHGFFHIGWHYCWYFICFLLC